MNISLKFDKTSLYTPEEKQQILDALNAGLSQVQEEAAKHGPEVGAELAEKLFCYIEANTPGVHIVADEETTH